MIKSLVDWYQQYARDLPWRKRYDPYEIWISEVMLQQTQVVTVIPYFNKFIERFPNIKALSEGSIEEVISLWSGLGYYKRGKNLKMAVEMIIDQYNGRLPADLKSLLTLPGIGRYTA